MHLEVVKMVFETIVGPIVVALLIWSTVKMRKLVSLLNGIIAMKCDITDLKSIACATLCRLDAQDEATKQIFHAMEMGRVNGEAKAAIGAMETARNNTDEIIRQMSLKKERPEPIW